ncbi:MAG TPA: hypothetical protein VFH15_04000, partial [Pyrinomonadaceae bacterium]|nr:hypothetical protein [Pyrinomonadaceae bacterium]
MSLQATLILILICSMLSPSPALRVNNDHDDNSALLEVGSAAPNAAASKDDSSLKIVSYNIRWRSGDQ